MTIIDQSAQMYGVGQGPTDPGSIIGHATDLDTRVGHFVF